MTDPTDLVADQTQRHASIDPLLPVATAPVPGRTLVAALPDGTRITGTLEVRTARGTQVWELTPFVGRHGGEAMEAVLRALRAQLDRTPPPAESVCTLTWPSRDAECTRPLLAHGLLPVLALGLRTRSSPPTVPGTASVAVRRAGPRDVGSVERLARAHAALCSASTPATACCAEDDPLADVLNSPGRVWVAEGGLPAGGPIVGMVQVDEVPPGAPEFADLLPAGRWGRLAQLSVHPEERGHGVGRALADTAHDALARAGLERSTTWYSPLDPVAPVFWHRQGYRPLWTVWQCRPASALR
ncbi:GNAT family N-acetyltransferase [Saccharomonospora cyanea]|uniref:Acetyltransferase n=1 Tax=Saccharomonospora cyanea NA-134 TaxID=882082 RepID=H5XR46_9PSEU|nr:GNAT family N-acetyltransferase [Saccharomonospora cyanea]EHR62287.1 acetyltransferase [Saccharomonospora cyanea NA-134]